MNERWRYRETENEDLLSCFELLEDKRVYTEGEKQSLLAFWKTLLQSGNATSAVMEDAIQSSCPLVAFGMSIYVTDAFIERIQKDYLPNRERTLPTSLGKYLLHRHALNDRFIRDKKALARNQNARYNLIVLHFAIQSQVNDEEYSQIVERMGRAFFQYHSRTPVQTLVKEVYSEEQFERHLGFGYKSWEGRNQQRRSATSPYMVGITREEALSRGREAYPVRAMFAYQPQMQEPIFTPSQLRMLLLIVQGVPRKQLHKELGIEENSVNVALRRMYAMIEAKTNLFADVEAIDEDNSNSYRKYDKLRLILHKHPEMLEQKGEADASK